VTWPTPSARHLITAIANNPPARCLETGTFNRPASYFVPDPRLNQLRAMWKAAEPEVDTPEWRAWLRADPETVVREAIEQQREGGVGALPSLRSGRSAAPSGLSRFASQAKPAAANARGRR
jgi:hypothetical protein